MVLCDGSSLGAAARDSFKDSMQSLGQSLNKIADRRNGTAHKPDAVTLCIKPATMCIKTATLCI